MNFDGDGDVDVAGTGRFPCHAELSSLDVYLAVNVQVDDQVDAYVHGRRIR